MADQPEHAVRPEATDTVSEQPNPGASQDQVEHRSPLTAPESKVDWGDWTIPKRPKHGTKRQLSGDDSSDPEWSDSGESSEWTDSDGDDGYDDHESVTNVSVTGSDGYRRFDTRDSGDANSWGLPQELGQYLLLQVASQLDKSQKKALKEEVPAPKEACLDTAKVDSDFIDMLDSVMKGQCKMADKAMASLHESLAAVMGPLGKAWVAMEKMRATGESAAPADLLRWLEMTVCLLGQALWKTSNRRRLLWLAKFLGDFGKAASILKEEASSLPCDGKKLFGTKFLKRLYRRAKGTKQASMIKSVLGAKKTHGKKFKKSQGDKRPFRAGPPSQTSSSWRGRNASTGAHAASSRGRGGGGRGKSNGPKRYVVPYKGKWVAPGKSGESPNKTTKCASASKGRQAGHGADRPGSMGGSKRSPMGVSKRQWVSEWKVEPMFAKLDGGDRRPRDTGDGKRGEVAVCVGPSAERSKAGRTSVCPARMADSGCRDYEFAGEGGHRGGQRSHNRVLRSSFHKTQERWINETCVQPETTQQVCSVRALQDGKSSLSHSNDRTGRLDGVSGPERCLLFSPNPCGTQEVPAIHVGGADFPVQSHSIRPGFSTTDLHQDTETSDSIVEASGDPNGTIPGRLPMDEPGVWFRQEGQGLNPVCVDEGRVHHQLVKVSVRDDPSTTVLGSDDRFGTDETFASTSQSCGHQESMYQYVETSNYYSQTTGKTGGEVDINSVSNSSRTIVLQGPTNVEDSGPTKESTELRGRSDIDSGVQNGAVMVGGVIGAAQWTVTDIDQPRPNDHNRCLQDWLGCSDEWDTHPRSMVREGDTAAHKPLGVTSSTVCIAGIYKEPPEHPCTSENGQFNSSGSCEQTRGHPITIIGEGDKGTVAVLSGEKDHSYCRTSTGGNEQRSRLSVAALPGQQQLETGSRSILGAESAVGTLGGGSLCRSPDGSISNICELETGSGGKNDRCIFMQMEWENDVCLPSILPHHQMSGQIVQGWRGDDSGNSNLEHPAVVSSDTGEIGRQPNTVAENREDVNITSWGDPSFSEEWSTATGSMEDQRSARQGPELSEDATQILLESRRKGTRKAYHHPWQEWSSWCDERLEDPVQAPVELVANFLTEKFNTGLEYSTLNVYRSAISAYHEPIQGQSIGQHVILTKLLKGMFNSRPPQPKYTETWDVDVVLDRIRRQPNNEDLSLKDLSLKLVMLMALTTASRHSELHKLKVSSMCDKGDIVEFHIGDLTKTRKVGEGPLVVQLVPYDPEPKLDVVSCLRQYLAVTKSLRRPATEGEQLLISFRQPHGPLAASSVARWLKMGLTEAGIDVTKYQAHSTRSAATSKVASQGLQMAHILERANWSREMTFKRYYYKTIECIFQNKVLE